MSHEIRLPASGIDHDLRATGIGGSDVAAILGVSPWRTPLDVYLEKRRESPMRPDSPAMSWGRRLEPVVLAAYEDETGRRVSPSPGMLRSVERPWMIANIDGMTDDEPPRIVEAKTARVAEGWGEPGTDTIPVPYLLQVQHYLCVCQADLADVVVLIGGSDLRIYTIEADRDLHADLIEAEREFWGRVERGDPPDPVNVSDAQRRFRRPAPGSVARADAATEAVVARLRATRAAIASRERDEEECKLALMNAIGDAEELHDADGRALVTWRLARAASRVDMARLKAEHPEVYAACLVEAEPTRRFLLK